MMPNARHNYNRLSRWYDLFAASEKRFVEMGLQMLAVQPGERTLEIGCGTGSALVKLAHAGHTSAPVSALDISPGMLRQARGKVINAGLGAGVNFSLGDAVLLPYAFGTFDAVFMSFTLELFTASETALALDECRRVLRSTGRLGVVALAKQETAAVRVYEWFHARLPEWIDCRPIHASKLIAANGFQVMASAVKSMWGLPVEIILARKT